MTPGFISISHLAQACHFALCVLASGTLRFLRLFQEGGGWGLGVFGGLGVGGGWGGRGGGGGAGYGVWGPR